MTGPTAGDEGDVGGVVYVIQNYAVDWKEGERGVCCCEGLEKPGNQGVDCGFREVVFRRHDDWW